MPVALQKPLYWQAAQVYTRFVVLTPLGDNAKICPCTGLSLLPRCASVAALGIGNAK